MAALGESESRETFVNLNCDDSDSQIKRQRNCHGCTKTFLKMCSYIVISVFVYIFMSHFESWTLTPVVDIPGNAQFASCVPCDIVDFSSGRWTKNILDGKTVCCLAEDDTAPRLPISQASRELPRSGRIGAQLYINQTALRGNPASLVWSSTSADLAYVDEGILHSLHIYLAHEYDCLEVTVTRKFFINIQMMFINRKQHTGKVSTKHGRSPRQIISSYFTVIRFRDNEYGTLARVPVTLPAIDRLSGTTFIKVPGLLFREFPLQKGDRICIATPYLDLINADPYVNYFGILAL